MKAFLALQQVLLCLFINQTLFAAAADSKRVPVTAEKQQEPKDLAKTTYVIQKEGSEFLWTGKKKFVGSKHTGTISLKNGSVEFQGKEPHAAQIIIDMTSISNTDLKDEGYKKKLIDHLLDEDFFAVSKFPQASLQVDKFEKHKKEKETYIAHGTLTIRGTTQKTSITFQLQGADKDKIKAFGTLTFDRTKFGVNYRPESSWFENMVKKAKDKIIEDLVSVKFEVVATAQTKKK